MRNRNRSAGFGLILLAYQILGVVGVDRIPPVTLGVLAAQVAIYLRLFQPPWDHLSDACVSGDFVWTKKNWFRLLFASFEHGDDWHLYYNMVSFVWKGISLERRLGSKRFFCILAIFSVLVNIVYVMLAELASIYFDPHYHYRCAVGFSGVIFALKVVTTHYSRSSTSFIFGSIPIPSQYAVWSELILIHLLVPRSSFIGHLAGILVGLAYVYGPLQKIIDNLLGFTSERSYIYQSAPSGYRNYQSYDHRNTSNSRQSRYANSSYGNTPSAPPMETHYEHYIPHGMSEDEQYVEAVRASQQHRSAESVHQQPPYPVHQDSNDGSQTSSNLYPNLDALRSRRLQRYDVR